MQSPCARGKVTLLRDIPASYSVYMAITRRDLLKWSLAGVAAKLSGCAVSETAAPRDKPAAGGLPRRILGRTEQSVTILGLGCAYIARDADEAGSRATVEAALEGGVRYFDTSPDYKFSELRLGPVLAPVRDEIFLVTKINFDNARGAERDLTRSLKLLKTDHVDLLLQHCVGTQFNAEQVRTMLDQGGALEYLRKAKARGLTRFIGINIHHPFEPSQMLMDASDEWDVIMPFISYLSAARIDAERHVVAPAHRKGLGVTAMKVLGGHGQLADDYDRAFRYALSVPGVACAVIGAANVDEVRRAVRAAKAFRPLTKAEMKQTLELGKQMVRERSPKVGLLERHMPRDLGGVWHA